MKRASLLLTTIFLLLISSPVLAFDSYRYLHVTIDTVWYIFVFLLIFVLIPFILMAVLYWWSLTRPKDEEQKREEERQ